MIVAKHMRCFLSKFSAVALVLAMVVVMCSPVAMATETKRYNTLDEVEENSDVFHSIRTGNISAIKINGDWYYQFHESGCDIVQIKATAFETAPSNNYLNWDNARLSEKCEETWDRVCYYTDMVAYNSDRVKCVCSTPRESLTFYTISMYRFELNANAKQDDGIDLTAKMTSGITFDYCNRYCYQSSGNTSYWKRPDTESECLAMLVRRSAEPIRPSANISIINNQSQDVCLSYYQFTGWKGVYSEIDGYKYLSIGLDAASCIFNTIVALNDPTKITVVTAMLSCGVAADSALSYSKESSGCSQIHNSIPGREYSGKVTFPVMLQYSNNYVQVHYHFSGDFDTAKTDFLVAFEFTNNLGNKFSGYFPMKGLVKFS